MIIKLQTKESSIRFPTMNEALSALKTSTEIDRAYIYLRIYKKWQKKLGSYTTEPVMFRKFDTKYNTSSSIYINLGKFYMVKARGVH